MSLSSWLLFFLIALKACLCVDIDEPCRLEGVFANCYRLIDGSMIEATALINLCHDPMDITFVIEAKNPAITWQHTFISTNLGERVIMPQFGLHTDLMLDINMHKSRLNSKNDTYSLQVSFVGARNELLGTFLRTELSRSSKDIDCFGDRKEFYIKIAVTVCVTGTIVILSAVLGYMIYKRKKRKAAAESLVNNMEPQASSNEKRKSRKSPQVEFRSSNDEPTIYLSTGSGIQPVTDTSRLPQLS